MKYIKIIGLGVFLFFAQLSFGQIKNKKIDTFEVSGNCGMCKKNIETAVFQRNVSIGTWSASKQKVTITYDSLQTNPEKLLQKIADAGYDNEKFTADDQVYDKLHGCCHYERRKK